MVLGWPLRELDVRAGVVVALSLYTVLFTASVGAVLIISVSVLGLRGLRENLSRR